jgi:hypothetical protein
MPQLQLRSETYKEWRKEMHRRPRIDVVDMLRVFNNSFSTFLPTNELVETLNLLVCKLLCASANASNTRVELSNDTSQCEVFLSYQKMNSTHDGRTQLDQCIINFKPFHEFIKTQVSSAITEDSFLVTLTIQGVD